MPDTTPLHEHLRQQAAEALRIASLVPEAARAALLKVAADFLAAAVELEAATTVVVAPEESLKEIRRATDPKADT